jgi:hypothetical protein
MNDWLIRLEAKADIPIGNGTPPAVPGFATLGDDFHDGPGSHIEIQTATLQGNQLTLTGVITESKSPGLPPRGHCYHRHTHRMKTRFAVPRPLPRFREL